MCLCLFRTFWWPFFTNHIFIFINLDFNKANKIVSYKIVESTVPTILSDSLNIVNIPIIANQIPLVCSSNMESQIENKLVTSINVSEMNYSIVTEQDKKLLENVEITDEEILGLYID